jgi:hypothetical protein
MSSQFQRAIDSGRQARAAAAKVRNALFPGWRQRRFRRQLGRFIVALQSVPQSEAGRLTAADISTLTGIVNGVVLEAEGFMAERHDATTAEVEQDRFVVTEIYQLRAILETLARGITADPNFMDVGFVIRTESGNQPKS